MDLKNLKQNLQTLAQQKREAKEKEDQERETRNQEDRQKLLESMSQDLGEVFGPYIEALKENSQLTSQELSRIIAESVQVDIPEFDVETIAKRLEEAVAGAFSKVRIPAANAPVVNVPAIKIPEIRMPEEMEISGWIGIMGYDKGLLQNPIPVQLRDAKGNPVDFSQRSNTVVSSGGGGKSDFFTIKGFSASAFMGLQDPDGRIKVVLPSGSSGLTDAELRASAVETRQVSGSIDSVYVTGVAASFFSDIQNGDGRVRVELPAGATGLTDGELRASAVETRQVSGGIDSVYVQGVVASFFAEILNPDGRVKVEVPAGASGLTDTELRASHLDVQQLSGSIDSVYVTGAAVSTYQELLNPDGRTKVELADATLKVDQVSGSVFSVNNVGPVGDGEKATALRMLMAGDAVASVVVNQFLTSLLVDQLSGAVFSVNNVGPLNQGDAATALRVVIAGNADASVAISSQPITLDTRQVSGAIHSVSVTGVVDSTFIPYARQTNITPVANGADVRPAYDDLGRQVTRSIQVRDLIQTAYLSLTNGTETTLRAAVAGAYLDLIMVVASNNSDAAVSVDIRPVTGGNIVNTLRIPANGTAGWTPAVPWPQTDTGNNWTVDGPDETGRTLTFSALFSQEV